MSANIIATSLVIDDAGQGTHFPSAGGNSSDPLVQAVYWRCAAVCLTSARLSNPDSRLAFFSNTAPPKVDGVDLSAVFARLGVETHRVEATARLPIGRMETFGNVLYFIDIFESLAGEAGENAVLLLDCDVVLTRSVTPLFDVLRSNDFAGYRLDTQEHEDINGLTRLAITAAADDFHAMTSADPIAHYGGELFGARLASWREQSTHFANMLKQAQAGSGAASGIKTEEHMFSVAFAAPQAEVFDANPFIKRIWTSPRHSTVEDGDELLAMWHVPAEKRYGLRDLFTDLASCDFDKDLKLAEFRALAGRRCGIPRKSAQKVIGDGVRQIGAKLGVRN